MKIDKKYLSKFIGDLLNLNFKETFKLQKLMKLTENLNLDQKFAYIMTGFDLKNYWINLPVERLDEIPLPALSLLNSSSSFPVPIQIEKIEAGVIEFIDVKSNRKTASITDLFKGESAYVLLFENDRAPNSNRSLVGLDFDFSNFMMGGFLVFAFILFAILFPVLETSMLLVFCLSIIGVFAFLFIINHALENEYQLINRVCNASNSNCKEIFKFRPFDSIFFDFKLLGLAYFSTVSLIIIVSVFLPSQFSGCLFLMAIMGIIGVLSSWAIQFFHFKKKCLICILISLVICVLVFLIFNASNVLPSFSQLLISSGFYVFSYFGSYLYLSSQEYKTVSESLVAESIAIKSNSKVFNFLLDEMNKSELPELDDIPVCFGNKEGHELGLVISLKCNKCYEMLNDLIGFISTFENAHLKIWFAGSKDITIEERQVLNLLLHDSIRTNLTLFKEVMKEWYEYGSIREVNSTENKDLFIKGITTTPMVFLNMKVIPTYYQYKDIKFLLNSI